MVLDDSGSMRAKDVKGSIAEGDVDRYGKVTNILRTTALDRTVTKLLHKYKDKAYLGISFLWQGSLDKGLVHLPVADYSAYSEKDFKDKIVLPTSKLILNSPGNTPVARGIYESIKMFRGQPINKGTSNNVVIKAEGSDRDRHYGYTERLETPLRYRCQQNHMVIMTDGEPNDHKIYGVAIEDSELYGRSAPIENLARAKLVKGVDMSLTHSSVNTAHLGKITANTDLRTASKPYIKGYYQEEVKNGKVTTIVNVPIWANKDLDDAGKDWINDRYSTPMPIYTHTVSLFVNPKAALYTNLTSVLNKQNNKEFPGMNLGFEKGGGAEDLLQAFDTIFASIILSTSSTLSMNDRIYSDLLEHPPVVNSDGTVDLKTLGTIRYDTVYDFRPRFGSVRAMVPYISGYDVSQKNPANKNDKGKAIIKGYELWNTDTSITPAQGRYVTYLKIKDRDSGLYVDELKNPLVLSEFKKIKPEFVANYIEWLTNFKKTDNLGDLRGRLNPLGSITNSTITTVNKDVLNINLASEKMAPALKKDLSNWLLFKAKHQPNNLLVIADNDGFISFIKAQRGLAKGHRGGERDTAYFPQLLVHRFDEIAKSTRNATLVLEGKTDLVDAKVYQPIGTSGEHVYATIGLTSMGGGGKGLVGYRIYADKVATIDSWAANKTTTIPAQSNNIYNKVTPLFEISNEGPASIKSKGFEDLGYTYSGFEFFNRIHDGHGQAVAVFGNGFGTEKSVVYFIDAYTGEKLHEIVLDPKGKGAATPSIVVSNDGEGGQKINRLYIGDYSGTLYKVEFAGSDFTASTTKITALFKTPETNFGQSAISVKPLVVKKKNSDSYRIFFGTGLAASLELDRYDPSLVTHAFYSITDASNKRAEGSQTTAGDLPATLTPMLSIDNLKMGRVKYREGEVPNYEKVDRYNLTTHTPVANPNEGIVNGNDNGWYIVLSADNNNDFSLPGEKGSGERVIHNPQYDSLNDAVVFSTWGIKERGSQPDIKGQEDPCVSDLAFGKVLSFYAKTGGGSFDIGIANKGTTGKAEGGLTGDGIKTSPEGNEATDLSELDLEVKNFLLQTVDTENSAYEVDTNKLGAYCVGGLDGQTECVEIDRIKKNLGTDPVRLSVHELYEF